MQKVGESLEKSWFISRDQDFAIQNEFTYTNLNKDGYLYPIYIIEMVRYKILEAFLGPWMWFFNI